MAELIVDALVSAGIMEKSEVEKAIEITTEEIECRIAVEKLPFPEWNWDVPYEEISWNEEEKKWE